MGGKISKRAGSYNLKKKEKKIKKVELSEGRATSIINLTLSQIYEDELKTPRPEDSDQHKNLNHSHGNQHPLTESESKQNLYKNSDSERDAYSEPDDERIYENIIIGENGSGSEEQVEIKEEKRRKTWSQSQPYDGDKYLETHNLGDESEKKKEGPDGSWKEILNGGYWKDTDNSNSAEQIEVKEAKSEEQVEVEDGKEGQINRDLQMEQLEVRINENDIHHNPTTENINDTPSEEQIEVESENNSFEQIEVREEGFQQDDLNNKKSNIYKDITAEAAKNPENIITISTDQIIQNNENKENKNENINKINNCNSEEEEETQLIDIPLHETQTLNNVSLINEDQVVEEPRKHKVLYKTISSNSDVYYEVASEGWMEESEYDDLFYDAEDFQDEAQVEVIDKNIKEEISPKGDLNKANDVGMEKDANCSREELVQNETTAINTNDVTNQSSMELEKLKDTDNKSPEKLLIDIRCTNTEIDASGVKKEENFDLLIKLNVEDSSGVFRACEESSRNERPSEEDSRNNSENSTLLIDLEEDNKMKQLLERRSDYNENFREIGVTPEEAILVDFSEEEHPTAKEIKNTKINQTDNYIHKGNEVEVLNNIERQGKNDELTMNENQQCAPLVSQNEALINITETIEDVTNSDLLHEKYQKAEVAIIFNDDKNSNSIEAYPKRSDTVIEMKCSSSFNSKENIKDEINEKSENSSPVSEDDIVDDKMKLWEKEATEEDEGTLLQINAIINTINEVKLQIDNLESTEKDKNVHTEIYQTLIKLMRDVNSINNNNFNENVIKLQNEALNGVHNCLKNLHAKDF